MTRERNLKIFYNIGNLIFESGYYPYIVIEMNLPFELWIHIINFLDIESSFIFIRSLPYQHVIFLGFITKIGIKVLRDPLNDLIISDSISDIIELDL